MTKILYKLKEMQYMHSSELGLTEEDYIHAI